MTVSAEARAVIWSARPVSQGERFPEGVDVRQLVSLLREHKLSSTAFPRMAADDSVPPEIVRAVARLNEESGAHADAIREDVRRLGDELADHVRRHGPVLYLKGHSAQIHTSGAYRAHRPTTDLDLLADDPDDLHATLLDLGYHAGKPGISHELSSLHRADRVDIDLHRYFPAWSYPSEVVDAAGVHLPETGRVRTRKLTHAVLLESSIPHPDVEAGTIRVPGLEATALLTALHAFKDYVEASFTHGERKITLIEVLEFGELESVPSFNEGRFDELVALVDGAHAVGFVRSLLGQLRGDAVVAGGHAFPREIGRGFLRATDEPLESLVQIRSFYEGLIAERPLDAWAQLAEGSRVTQLSGSAMICRPSWYERDVSHEVSTQRRNDARIVRVESPTPRNELHYFVHVTLGFADRYEKVSLDLANDQVLRTANGVAKSMEISEDGDRWQAEFELPGDFADEYMVVHSYMFVRPLDDDWNHLYDEALVSTAIPLRLRDEAGA